MPLRYVMDEHLRGTLARTMERMAARQGFHLDVVQVGDLPDVPLGTPDPELIRWAESNDRIILTRDTRTMPGHLSRHLAAGNHSPGIFILCGALDITLVDWLVVYAYVTEPHEWRDQVTFVP